MRSRLCVLLFSLGALACSSATTRESCDGVEPVWAASFGSQARLLALPEGGAIVAGPFGSDFDLGGAHFTAGATDSLAVAHLDRAGTAVWSTTLEGGGQVIAMGRGSDGTIAISTGEGMLTVSATGAPEWMRAFPGFRPSAIAPGTSGGFVVLGRQAGAVDLGGGPLGASPAYAMLELDAHGGYVASADLAPAPSGGGNLAAIRTRSGDLVIAGSFEGTIDLGRGPLTSAGDEDLFVARFDATGHCLVSRRFGGTGNDGHQGFNGELIGLDEGPSGRIDVGSSFSDTVDFGDGPHTSSGITDVFVIALTADLATIAWVRTFGGEEFDAIGALAVDATERVAITGISQQASVEGVFACASVGASLPVVVLDAHGEVSFSHCYAATFAAAESIGFDDTGDLQVAGLLQPPVDLGAGPLPGTTLGGFAAELHLDCH